MDIKRMAAVFALSISSTVFASPITLTSDWESRYHGLGTLTFTYDDQTLDSNPDPQFGRYYRSILALDFLFGGMSYHLDTWEPNEIDIRAPFAVPSGGKNIHLLATLIGTDFQKYNMMLSVENYALAYTGTDSINEIIGRTNDDDNFSYLNKVGEAFGGKTDFLIMKTPFTQLPASVPEPSAPWLFPAGLAGIVLLRRLTKMKP